MGLCADLCKVHRDAEEKLLGLRGKYRKPFSRSASDIRDPRAIPNTGLYVRTSLGANGTRRVCRKVLGIFGYSDGDLQVDFADVGS